MFSGAVCSQFRAYLNRSHVRAIQGSARTLSKPLPPRIKIDESDITENFIKGGGAGGQKINKTSSQVQLIHHPTGIHIKCQATRSRAQNRTQARRILAERIEVLQQGDQSRTAIKAAKKQKQKANSMKKKRRKYRQLDEAKNGSGLEEDSQSEDEGSTKDSTQDPDGSKEKT